MTKNKPKKHVDSPNGPKTVISKRKNKIAAKLKEKLKSAIFNEKSANIENLAKKPKSIFKSFSHPSVSNSAGFKHPPKPKAKYLEDKSLNIGATKMLISKQAGRKQNVSQASKSMKVKDGSHALNAKHVKNGKHHQKKNKGASFENQPRTSETKRKVKEVKANPDNGKKRLKTVGGFLESNADDEEETRLVKEKLNKVGKKKLDTQLCPPIKIHDVEVNQVNGSGTNSDSEADSYIDKFFGDGNDDFDENHVYSLDEIEAENRNGFLSKASGNETKSDESSFSDGTTDDSLNENSPKNKLVGFKENDSRYGFEDFSWSKALDEGQSSIESSDMYETTDSEISLGSEVDSDDLDDTYECESTDVESMSEYEDDISYEGAEEFDSGSEYSYSDNDNEDDESASSRDTYDEFRYGDDHDSNEDLDYMDSRYDDLCLPRGTAVTYKITDKRIRIFENDIESRIVEVPKSDSDDENCVELIPMNMTRAKYQRIEQQKLQAKQAKLNELKQQEEKKQLEYEKSVADYYNMDNLKDEALEQTDESVTIVKCPKNFNHSRLDWMEADDESVESSGDTDEPYPMSKAKRVVVNNKHSSPKPEKSKTNWDQALDEIENEEESDESPEEEASVQTVSNSDPQFFNALNSRHVLLILHSKLLFHGSLHVRLIAGNVTAFGYELQHNKTVTLHSPHGHGLVCLTPHASTRNDQHLETLEELKVDFYFQDINYIKERFDSNSDAILLLQRDQTNKGVIMIDRYMRETVFPNINAFNNESPFYSSEFVLHCKFIRELENGLTSSNQWSTIKLHYKSKLVTIGGKGVGKSTFVRYLINSNFKKFQKFLFIDLDIGQPELFVPQTLSATIVTEPIIGPGYLRNFKPVKAVLFGDINVLPNPIKYLRCVLQIFAYCSTKNELSSIPWVINTMGYNRGFGSELMACILKIFKPTDLVQIQSQMQNDNFDQIMNANNINRFKFNVFESEMQQINGICDHKTHVFETVRGRNKKNTDMNAKDLRYAMILSKLGNCLKYDSDWLTSVKPFEASLNDLDVLVANDEEVKPSDILDLLNANLVYLCEKRENNLIDIIDCHGIGIVRSVDAQTNKIYLLSTIPLFELRYVNVLAIGTIPSPSVVFLNQDIQIRGAVPFVYNSDNFVGSKQVAQHIYRAESRSNNKQIQLMEY